MIVIPQLLKAKSPAILFSGGKDSLVLLDLARQIRPDLAIVHFYDSLRPEVEKVIELWSLEVISWRPAHQYFIPWGDDLALVNEYSFADSRLPVVRDVVEGEPCQIEKWTRTRTTYFDYPWDLTLWGYRKCDERHPVMKEPFPERFTLGPTEMLAPLYEWSDEDVMREVSSLPYEPFNDTATMCFRCQDFLSNWDRDASLEFFSKRFAFKEAA